MGGSNFSTYLNSSANCVRMRSSSAREWCTRKSSMWLMWYSDTRLWGCRWSRWRSDDSCVITAWQNSLCTWRKHVLVYYYAECIMRCIRYTWYIALVSRAIHFFITVQIICSQCVDAGLECPRATLERPHPLGNRATSSRIDVAKWWGISPYSQRCTNICTMSVHIYSTPAHVQYLLS